MTDVYTQENASKKKFLAPLLVILLCMVSLTAAGYAYSATVTNTDDPVVIDGITMELKNGENPVTGPMFEVNAHVGTHTTNGLAINYTAEPKMGFKTDSGAPVAYTDNFTGFLPGYYVALYNGDSTTSAGYNEPVAVTDIDTADELAAAITAKTVLPVDGSYSLVVNNGAAGAVTLTVNAKWAAAVEDFDGFNGVFVVIKNGAEVVAVEKVGNDDDATAFSGDVASGESTYTVEAYVALSDYYSASVPDDLDFNQKFNVFFKATA